MRLLPTALLLLFFFSFLTGNAEAKGQQNNAPHNSLRGYGAKRWSDLRFTLAEVEELDSYALPAEWMNPPQIFSAVDTSAVDLDELIAIGKKIFEIIQAGAPVVNIKTDTVAVVPKGITDWQDLGSWQSPKTKTYRLALVNGFGNTMADLRLKVTANWGGSLDGIGQYLANITVVPTYVRVSWGVNLDVWLETKEPLNMGTRRQPIAGMGLVVHYRAKTWTSQVEGSQDYFIRGDGQIELIKPENSFE